MEHYFEPQIECASREQITAWQDERLVETVKRVYESVPYYRQKMDDKGLKPEDIQGVKDLHKLPFLSKEDLRKQYPFGLLAVPRPLHKRHDRQACCRMLYAERP